MISNPSLPLRRSRLLDVAERIGNALPDPALLFVFAMLLLAVVSAYAAAAGWSAVNPVTGEALQARSLLTEASVAQLLGELPRTYAGFAPLGVVLTVVLGAGVADGSGLFAALLRASLRHAPARLLTPAVLLVGMLTCHASDAGYLVYVPLAGVVFAAAGRHPVVGIVTGFAGVAVGLAGNLLPGQYDVLVLGITETGARLVDPQWRMNPLGNWWFSLATALAFTTLGALVIERVVAPRFGRWTGGVLPLAASPAAAPGPGLGSAADSPGAIDADRERRGLRAAGLAALAVFALFAALATWPGYTPLYDESAAPAQRITPLYRSLPAAFFLLFTATGWAYGAATGSIRSHRDVVAMMARGLEGMVPYLVLVFFAALFVAMFANSNLGPLLAIHGAATLKDLQAPPALLLPVLTTLSSWLDFLIASGSAKWTAMAPVATPMLMLLGISPEMTTAAYRIGDTVTNLVSPLNPYIVLVLAYGRRWMPELRLGTLLAATLPLALAFYLAGVLLVIAWVALGLPVGPGATVAYHLPGAAP